MSFTKYPSAAKRTLSVGNGIVIPYLYIPLFEDTPSPVTTNSSSVQYVSKGLGTNTLSSKNYPVASAQTTLYKHSPLWSPTQNFALEVLAYSINGSGTAYPTNVALYDKGNSAVVSNSLISVSAAQTGYKNASIVRSGSFQLTPGNSYALQLYLSSFASGDMGNLAAARLIVLP